jgi:hypothetical protein
VCASHQEEWIFEAREERGQPYHTGGTAEIFSSMHNISKEISEIIFRLTQTLALLEHI